MIQVGNTWLVLGAVLPALFGSNATFPDTKINRFTYSSLLGLATVTFSTIELHRHLLERELTLAGVISMPVLSHLFFHFGLLVAIAWFFQFTANHFKATLSRALGILISNVLALGVTLHALLLHNYLS